MRLQRGEVQGYNFNRMAVEFTMVNQGKVVLGLSKRRNKLSL